MKRILVLAIAFVLVSGTSFAAGRYVITSTSQIKPTVLRTIESQIVHHFNIQAAQSESSGQILSGPCEGASSLLTGGGFVWEGPGRFELTVSREDGREWLIEGRVYGNGKLRATADCIAPAPQ